MTVDDRHRAVLRALANALIPAIRGEGIDDALASSTGESLGAAASVERSLRRLAPSRRRTVLRLLLWLDSPLTALLWIRRPVKFSALPAATATRLLEQLSASRLGTIRRAFDVLKRLVLIQAYGSSAATEEIWEPRGYPRVVGIPQDLRLSGRSLPHRCQTLVIGSGAGGAVAAAVLAESGQDVVVLEKGAEVPCPAMEGIEAPAMGLMFEEGGLMTTTDGAISLFAGSCLGGGTTVNWSASFRLPEFVSADWRRRHGIGWVESDSMNDAYRHVEARTNVGVDRPHDNAQNAALRQGCLALAVPVREVPRNTKGCTGSQARDCGRCGLGCAHGRKQGTARTFLSDVVRAGGSVIAGATVMRLLVEEGRAVGAEVLMQGESGPTSTTIRADRVILAAGALHTPAILLRSGVRHDAIGRNLHLHPTVGVAGRYDRPVRGWEGPIMTAYSAAFATMVGPWGVRLETAPIYPGLFASALPWNDAGTHKEDLDQIENSAAFIVLTRDRSSGRVEIDDEGNPSVTYRVSDPDLAMMLTGVVEAARIHVAAGAQSVLFPYSRRHVLDAATGEDRVADVGREIFTWGWRPGLYPLFSAHQMGSCRMGGDARAYPVDPEGRLRGVRSLYIADASLFPEASGVNPALTVQAMAHAVASQIR